MIIFSPSRERSDKIQYLSVLHHNVQLGNKLLELNALLRSWLSMPDILRFSERWLQKDQILHINIKHYKLSVSAGKKIGMVFIIFVSSVINVREVVF
jgi:hypothetical protein